MNEQGKAPFPPDALSLAARIIDYRHSEQGNSRDAIVGISMDDQWTISPEVSRRLLNTEREDDGSDACLSSCFLSVFILTRLVVLGSTPRRR